MHKSWGNAIEFDEAAERMGVDVMRWMYARRGPRTTSCSASTPPTRRAASCWCCGTCTRSSSPTRGWPAGRPAAGAAPPVAERPAAGPLDPVAGRRASRREVEARPARLRRRGRDPRHRRLHRRPLHLVPAPVAAPDVARRRRADRDAAFATLHAALVALARTVAPILPFLSRDDVPEPRRRRSTPARPDSVHLTPLAGRRAGARCATRPGGGDGRPAPGRGPGADAARPGRAQGPPAARPAVAGAARPATLGASCDALLELVRAEAERQGRGAHRRRVGAGGAAASRCCCRGSAGASGPQIPAVMAAARDGAVRDPRRTAR